MSVREVVVLACFLGVPFGLLILHIVLCLKCNLYTGFIAPIIWAMISVWIVKSAKGDGDLELAIVCIIIDAILLGILWLCRAIRKHKEEKLKIEDSHKN